MTLGSSVMAMPGTLEPDPSTRPQPVYMDYQATTPVDPRVRAAMMPFLDETFGNPHSVDHAHGWEAAAAVRRARTQVASLIGADDDEIVFTSGATESCNLALRGVVRAAQKLETPRRRIVTVATEHPAVLSTARDLAQLGMEVVTLPVKRDGLLDLARLSDVVDQDTLLVSVMAANNEIGIVQPLRDIAATCRAEGALLHTDATQAIARAHVSVDDWGVDLLSATSHKAYGPKGVGLLYVRAGTPIEAVLTGGGQEGGLRAGTVPTPLVVGFGVACEILAEEGEAESRRLSALAHHLLHAIRNACPDVQLFGHATRRIPGSICIGFPGIPAEQVVRALSSTVSVSTGSACASAELTPSPVLLALGFDPDAALTGLRLSLGRFTTEGDVKLAVAGIAEFVRRPWG